MIYECPQCRTPQQAGQTACPQCRAEFDGPVPDDAVLPPDAAPMPEAVPAADTDAPLNALTASADDAPLNALTASADDAPAGEQMPAHAEAVADGPAAVEAGRGGEVRAAGAETVQEAQTVKETSVPPPPVGISSGPAPYLTPPSYTPPPYSPPLSASAPLSYPPASGTPPPVGRLTRALLIAFPIVLVLVLGGVYLAGTLNTDSDAVPEPVPAVHASTPLPPAPTADAAPVTMEGGSNTEDGSDPHAKMLAGRWVSKSDNFYVFNPDGTGSRGSALNPSGDQPFLWGLVQNRLMIYGAKNETMRFNVGPDNDTIFLAPQTGHYVQYSRAKS